MARSNDSNGPKIVIALAAMSGVAFVFMGLRFFCKARYHKRFGIDDYLLAMSWVCLSYAACYLLGLLASSTR